ncbi:hypothetical protein PRIPAC_80916 [Pristionchus pacificus]|uniref:fatty acid amide hydrolase n=1 Tax=Pristionchus pacificus TaxID=54126 RepID=A0A2A6CLT5_PRIPA|nr:hypothetical protein PRIPAC_80916 [Pristionchus pacificus]|eukprot:PDM79013.1 amidase [Pristionchus pacificus]
MLVFVGAIILGLWAWFAYQRQQRAERVAHLKGKIAQRKNEQAELLEWARAEAEKIPSQRRKEIGAMDFNQLIAALQSGDVTSLEAVTTYIGLSLAAHEKTNCVTMYIKESVKHARALDGRRKSGESLPPLFGLPVSIKESIGVTGTDKTWGYAGSIHFPSTRDAPTVEMLKQLGAVPFVKTNVPLSLLSYTCGNEIYGWTENPHKKGRTPGGSTGGEAALIAAGGSLLGIGSDVGGSIRMPAHYAGIAGVKPSSMRLSLLRIDDGYHGPKRGGGYPLIEANEGPMAASMETCAEILKQFWASSLVSDVDPYKPPVGWNAAQFEEGRKYRIGYYTTDGWFDPTPGCVRVVEEARHILQMQGHTLVPFSLPDVPEMIRVYVATLTVDGGVSLMGSIEEDLPPAIFLSALRPLRVPILVQRSMAYVASALGYWRVAKFMRSMTKSSVELRRDYASIQLYRARVVEEMRKANIDMLLCPAQVMPAPPHEAPLHLSAGCSYTAIYNLLDFGAGVCRVGTWNAQDEAKLECYPTSDPWYTMAKKFSKDSVGLPLGVQVAAPPFKEEAVMRVLIDLERNVPKA